MKLQHRDDEDLEGAGERLSAGAPAVLPGDAGAQDIPEQRNEPGQAGPRERGGTRSLRKPRNAPCCATRYSRLARDVDGLLGGDGGAL